MGPTTRPPERRVAPMLDRRARAEASLAAASPEPVEGECLVCFAVRAVAAHGCTGDLAYVESFRRHRAPAASGVADRWARLGAGCACRIAPTGVWVLAREHLERDVRTDGLGPPDPLPACHGVAPASARPCALWERGRSRRGAPSRQAGAAACQARSTWGANASAIAE